MTKLLALIAVLASPTGFHSSAKPLPAPVKAQLKSGGFWHKGCPVGLSGLRLLTVSHRGWDGSAHTRPADRERARRQPLAAHVPQLYRLRFPIRHMRLADFYGPTARPPADGDVTASFECRQAAASPCTGGGGTGTWSQHAYGLAVDVNPVENPYVGCGQSRDPTAQTVPRPLAASKGMVTPRAIAAFGSIGWGWGGSWAGDTKDYMHFSSTGG